MSSRAHMKHAVAVLALLVAAPLARAEAPALEEAKKVAKQATIQYQLGNFELAADAYARSYALAPTPGLLFNLGQAQMMMKQFERAAFSFEGYLRDKPDAPNAALVQDLIAECKREIDAEREHRAAAEAARLAALLASRPPPPPPPPPPLSPRTRKLRALAMGLGLGGLALGGVGVALGLRAEIAGGLESLAAPGGDQHAGFDTEHRNYLISAAVIGGLGAAAFVTSGVLAYFGWRHPRTP